MASFLCFFLENSLHCLVQKHFIDLGHKSLQSLLGIAYDSVFLAMVFISKAIFLTKPVMPLHGFSVLFLL